MRFEYHDGGRVAAGFKGKTGDCVCRAVAIVTGIPYHEVYDELNEMSQTIERPRGNRRKSSARTGISMKTLRRFMEQLCWKWVPIMKIGSGCKVHLRTEELPAGKLIVRVSKHVTAVIDGVIRDTHDCSRSGTRCVYGYFQKID